MLSRKLGLVVSVQEILPEPEIGGGSVRFRCTLGPDAYQDIVMPYSTDESFDEAVREAAERLSWFAYEIADQAESLAKLKTK